MNNKNKLIDPIYDPLVFINRVELFTITMLASFITWKLLNSLYDNIYEPAIETVLNSDKTDKYYLKVGNYYVQIGMIFKEFIKWLIIIVILMIVHNLLT